jgi:hypothetical protein
MQKERIKSSLLAKRSGNEETKTRNARQRWVAGLTRYSLVMKLFFDLQKRKVAATTESREPISITAQPPQVLAEYLSSMQAKTFLTMSRIELEDMQITGS